LFGAGHVKTVVAVIEPIRLTTYTVVSHDKMQLKSGEQVAGIHLRIMRVWRGAMRNISIHYFWSEILALLSYVRTLGTVGINA